MDIKARHRAQSLEISLDQYDTRSLGMLLCYLDKRIDNIEAAQM